MQEKVYTVYDNLEGGYTIICKYFNRDANKFYKKIFYANNRHIMLQYTRNLDKSGYKFVGKI